jgi:hypothetical protein
MHFFRLAVRSADSCFQPHRDPVSVGETPPETGSGRVIKPHRGVLKAMSPDVEEFLGMLKQSYHGRLAEISQYGRGGRL